MTEGDELPPAPQGRGRRSLSDRSSAELHEQATKYRRMAQTARTMAVMESLYKLADRLDALAAQREREEKGGAG